MFFLWSTVVSVKSRIQFFTAYKADKSIQSIKRRHSDLNTITFKSNGPSSDAPKQALIYNPSMLCFFCSLCPASLAIHFPTQNHTFSPSHQMAIGRCSSSRALRSCGGKLDNVSHYWATISYLQKLAGLLAHLANWNTIQERTVHGLHCSLKQTTKQALTD
jgi:hypothetical protein